MGCVSGVDVRNNKIALIKTRNKESVFTSTEDIYKIYTFGKALGVGSFGKVLSATMKKSPDKKFAIKIIEKTKVKGRESLLADEIFFLQQLDHPNIIKFYEVYQNDKNFYICMDYCKGGELVEWIPKKYKSFHERNIQEIIRKIFSAVQYLHNLGIVHRDIKAENILITSKEADGEPKLIDFGLANKFDQKHIKRLKSFAGTPMYMAPEVIKGQYDEKCDVWSLGILLFTLMSGRLPFSGGSDAELYENIQKCNIHFDPKHWNQISNEVKDLVRKMLNKLPQLRPSVDLCLKHPWFRKQFQASPIEVNSALLNLHQKSSSLSNSLMENKSIYQLLKQQTKNPSKFKKQVKTLLVNFLNDLEMQALKEVFQKIDVDNSGTITISELRAALKQEGSPSTFEEVEKLIADIAPETYETDSKSHKQEVVIKYSQFLASCIDERKFITQEKLWTLFRIFDVDNTHFITRKNIIEAFARNGKTISDKDVDEMIAEIDPNHDNKISFEEFCLMFDHARLEPKLTQDQINQ